MRRDKHKIQLVGMVLVMAIWGGAIMAAAPESPIPECKTAFTWEGPCPREMPIITDLNGDGVQDYLLPSSQLDRFKEYMPPEMGAQFGLIGALMSMKASTGNKNFRFAAAVDGATGALLWKFEAGAYIDAYRLSQDGKRLYLSSEDNLVYALDPATGKKIWAYDFGGNVVGLGLSGDALVGATTNNRVVGLDPQNGSVLWEKPLSIELMSEGWGYLIQRADEVFVVSMDNKVHALNMRTGVERWICDTKGNPSLKTLTDGTLVVADGRDLAGVNVETGKDTWVCDIGGRPSIEPIMMVGGVMITFNGKAGSSAKLVAVRVDSGKLIWSLALQKMPHSRDRTIILPEDANYFRSSMAVDTAKDGNTPRLFIADRKRVLSLDIASAKVLWEEPIKEVQFVSLAGDKVLFQDKKKQIHCLETQTGKSVWAYEAAAPLRSVHYLDSMLVGTYSDHGGLVMDISSGKATHQLTLASPNWSFAWGEDRLFLAGGGKNWVLQRPNEQVAVPKKAPQGAAETH